MSSEQPELVRKLLGEVGPVDPSEMPSPAPSGAVPSTPSGDRPLVQVQPEEPDYLPLARSEGPMRPEPPDGLGRLAPSAWPWAATTRTGRVRNVAIVAFAIAGTIAGLLLTWYHVTTDPLADVHAYFDAAVRLNHGQPLYPASADSAAPTTYGYPPFLAVALRPVVLLGWPAFAVIWEAIIVGSFVLLVRQLGARPRTWLALGILAMPVGWCLAIGQAQVPLTLLLAIGQPWSIALGANMNPWTALAALWWIGRRDWQAAGAFLAWVVLLGLAQAVLELNGSISFIHALTGDEIGHLLARSPFAFAPLTWVLLVGLGAIVVLVWAKSRWGWLAAVALSTLAALPVLPWRLTALLAAVREPRIAGAEPEVRPFQPIKYGRR